MKQLLKILYILYVQTIKVVPNESGDIVLEISNYYALKIGVNNGFSSRTIDYILYNRNTDENLMYISIYNFKKILQYKTPLKPKKLVKLLLNISYHFAKYN